ncbi:MAG: SpoIID/LytB domain-containing protein [Gemmatimonadaceae bacterium]|nr:SpoIID/LytB domain-containing protein [Gemmatimonadaceae bacterium]
MTKRVDSWASVFLGGVITAAAVMVACAPALTPGIPTDTPASSPSADAAKTTSGSGLVRGESSGRLERGRDRMAMIALEGRARLAPVSATGRWRIDEQGGRGALVRGQGDEPWRIEQNGRLLRVAGDGDDSTPWREGPFVARPIEGEVFVRYNGKRYRGELWFTATDSGVMVVNRLPVEDYLRGVVPLEIGTRTATDRAAIEAQTIAARSYTYVRVPEGVVNAPVVGWNLTATVQHQVYGGVEAEHPEVNAAIDATAGLVLRYNDKLVDAPFYSSCGGRTAVSREAWRGVKEEPYLQSVSDIDPRTGRPYCDLSPKNHWHAEFDEAQLAEVVRRALQASGAPNPRPTAVQGVKVEATGPSGRVTSLALVTDRGNVTVSARDIRAVMRDPRGAILPSTYFSVDRESRRGARLSTLTLRGAGNGHGVGMCQWGAIGRARAGADARSILRHYYPGTVVGFAD